jgi:hypothetical protein
MSRSRIAAQHTIKLLNSLNHKKDAFFRIEGIREVEYL